MDDALFLIMSGFLAQRRIYSGLINATNVLHDRSSAATEATGAKLSAVIDSVIDSMVSVMV